MLTKPVSSVQPKPLRIGLVDSGIGLCTAAFAIKERFKHHDVKIVGLGHNAHFPFGEIGNAGAAQRSENVRAWTASAVNYLAHHWTTPFDRILIACHTASSQLAPTLNEIQHQLGIPVDGIIGSGALEAVRTTKTGAIGVLATEQTVQSGAYEAAINTFDVGIRVVSRACSNWVRFIEENSGVVSEEARRLVGGELSALKAVNPNIDTVILGCTHFPMLRPTLRFVSKGEIAVIDPAQSFAEKLYKLEGEHTAAGKVNYEFYFTKELAVNTHHLAVNFLRTYFDYGVVRLKERPWKEIVQDWEAWWQSDQAQD